MGVNNDLAKLFRKITNETRVTRKQGFKVCSYYPIAELFELLNLQIISVEVEFHQIFDIAMKNKIFFKFILQCH